MQNNLLLKALMKQYQLRSDDVANLMAEQLDESIKKRKVNAFCVAPNNKSFQHCHDKYLLALLRALASRNQLNQVDRELYLENQHYNADLKAIFTVKYVTSIE